MIGVTYYSYYAFAGEATECNENNNCVDATKVMWATHTTIQAAKVTIPFNTLCSCIWVEI